MDDSARVPANLHRWRPRQWLDVHLAEPWAGPATEEFELGLRVHCRTINATFLLILVSALPQWGTCTAPVGAPRASLPLYHYEWKKDSGDPGRWYLYKNGQLAGGYDVDGDYFRSYQRGIWGAKGKPPIAPPQAEKEELPTGVEWDKINGKDKDEYTLSGKKVSKQEAYAAVAKKELVDDSKLPHLTLIGSEEERKRVLNDLAPSGLLAKVRVQSYGAGDPLLKGMGFAEGSPAIYLQAPSGKVLLRQASYSPGPLFAAIRKADPTYDPKKDPDGSAPPVVPGLPSLGNGSYTLIGMAALGVVLALVYFFQRRQG